MKLTKEMLKRVIREELEAVTEDCWDGYERNYDVPKGAPGSCRKKGSVNEEEITDAEEEELKKIRKELEGASKMHKGQADRIGKAIDEGKKNCGCGQDPCITYGLQEEKQEVSEDEDTGKKDACYKKIKAAVLAKGKTWPSAYASGRLVQCRDKGAANWKEGEPKNEGKQSSEDAGDLSKWFGRQGEKGPTGGWVDCKAPDGDGGYKECAQGDRKKKPYCQPTPSACKKEPQNESMKMNRQRLMEIIKEEFYNAMATTEGMYYEVDALDENEEYCPVCADQMEEAKKKKKKKKKKKACKPTKGKRFAKRVDGKCVSHGQAGKAKGGGDRIRPGTKKADAYCARSAGIKKCKNPPCANTLSRKKWKCRGKKSMRS